MGHHRRLALVALAMGAGLLVGGCWLGSDAGRTDAIRVENPTGETITIFRVRKGEETDLLTLPPKSASAISWVFLSPWPAKCTDGDLIARTADGREVDRRPLGAICVNEDWVIGRPPPSPSPS